MCSTHIFHPHAWDCGVPFYETAWLSVYNDIHAMLGCLVDMQAPRAVAAAHATMAHTHLCREAIQLLSHSLALLSMGKLVAERGARCVAQKC
jgi:hypothetical protein